MATRELREHFKATRHSERLSATPGNSPSWARCSAAAGSSSPRPTAAPDDAAKDDDDCIESAPVADSTQRAVTRGPAVEQLLGEGDLRSLGCFHRDGCAVLEQGILGSKRLSHDACIRECERLQREVMQRWWGDGPDAVDTIHLDHGTTGRRTPVAGTRALAATFLEMFRLGGEEALALVESPRVLELARRALGCEEVVIDRVSCGDPLTLHGDSASQGGMPAPEGWQRTDGYNDNVLARTGLYPSTAATRENQFIWHTDRSGHTQHEMPQVYFRSVLDPQLGSGAEGNNARLRLWPGSQHWSEERLDAQLQAMAQAEGGTRPDIATQDQPEQIVVDVTPQQTLMWCVPLPLLRAL